MRLGSFRSYLAAVTVLLVYTTNVFAFTYVVKEGDKLSKIAGTYIPGPVWGKRGSLKRILDLNPSIKNPEFIFPNEEIGLGDDLRAGPTIEIPENESPAPKLRVDGQTEIVPTRGPAAEEATPENLDVSVPVKREGRVETLSGEEGSGAEVELAPSYATTTLFLKDPATGRKATVASQLNLGLDVNYYQAFSETFRAVFSLSLDYVTFEPPTDATKSLSGKNNFLSTLGIGGELHLSQKFLLEVIGSYGKELLGRTVSTTNIEIQAVNVPALSVRAAYDLLSYRRSVLGVSARTELKLPTSTDDYSVRLGALYSGIIYLRQQNLERKTKYRIELEAQERIQNTSLIDQTEMNLILRVRLPFEIK